MDKFMQVAVVINLTGFTCTKNAEQEFKGFRRSGDKFESRSPFQPS